MNETPPVEVRSTPYFDMATSAVRSAVLVIGALVALAGFVSKHDWAGMIDYVQTAPFITSLATVSAAGAFLWGQWKTRYRANQLTTVAANPDVPDSAAKLKS
jgi:hypothetical protein